MYLGCFRDKALGLWRVYWGSPSFFFWFFWVQGLDGLRVFEFQGWGFYPGGFCQVWDS